MRKDQEEEVMKMITNQSYIDISIERYKYGTDVIAKVGLNSTHRLKPQILNSVMEFLLYFLFRCNTCANS